MRLPGLTAASAWRASTSFARSSAARTGSNRASAEARRAELQREIERAEGKLANQGFVAKAPEAVVQAERDKLERLREELAEL